MIAAHLLICEGKLTLFREAYNDSLACPKMWAQTVKKRDTERGLSADDGFGNRFIFGSLPLPSQPNYEQLAALVRLWSVGITGSCDIACLSIPLM